MSTITELPSALPLITSSRQFLDSEQHIVDFILANTDRAPQMTSAQLARASSTSEASVSRFCKKLGFKNYRSFQFSLARDLAAREGDERVTGEVTLDDIEQSLANIKHAKQREIEATLDALESLGLARIRDQHQHIVLAHGEGERGRALRDGVRDATDAELAELDGRVDGDGVRVAHGGEHDESRTSE